MKNTRHDPNHKKDKKKTSIFSYILNSENVLCHQVVLMIQRN